jgi:tRNA(fMet)-specific endonuclease VapC
MGAPNEDKQRNVQKLTDNFSILPFTEDVAKQAAIIYHQLKKKNQLIEFRDIFIAATCIVNNIPLVTANRKHFDRIEGLQLA